MLTACECDVGPSVAFTVTVYGFRGMVAAFRVTVAVPVLLESACEVAVIVTEAGRLAAMVGAVYLPLVSIEPDDAVQFTAVLVVLVTLAEKFAVCDGQPALFGYRLADAGLTVTITGLLPPPQAISNPSSTSDTHNPAATECFDTLRATSPAITMPAIGRAKGSHGDLLAARC
jgi:hypothetical protein